jgi:oligoribonuclease
LLGLFHGSIIFGCVNYVAINMTLSFEVRLLAFALSGCGLSDMVWVIHFLFCHYSVGLAMIPEDRIIWIDLEMTGLDTASDCIIEIATVVTESDLTVVAEGPVLAIYQDDVILSGMDAWNTKQHGKSGLTDRVRASEISEAQAQAQTIEFLREHVLPGKSPMAGNSICQDRRFLARCMPELEAFFHYRHLDVTTLKILADYWRPELSEMHKKGMNHLALQDVYDSIEELRFYRAHFLRCPGSGSDQGPEETS